MRRLLTSGLVLLAAACSSHSTPVVVRRTPSLPPKPVTVTRPTSAKALGIALDPHGRPYDAPIDLQATTSTRPYGRLHIEGGRLRVLDGSALAVFPSATGDETADVELGATEDVLVDIVWEREVYKDKPSESVLGVLLKVPGAGRVEAWGDFESAYGTDGGQGGVTSQAVLDRAAIIGYDKWKQPSYDEKADVVALDLDGRAGVDSLLFSNGFGDGGFPMSRGRDARGRVVAVMIWDTRYPWRLAVPVGTPPSDVTERENQLQACIDGKRAIEVYQGGQSCSEDLD